MKMMIKPCVWHAVCFSLVWTATGQDLVVVPAPDANSSTTTTPAVEIPRLIVTVPEAARLDPEFSSLVAAFDAVGLSTALATPGPFTIFAPTDDAFASANLSSVERWRSTPDIWTPQLVDFLSYHIVENDELLSLELSQLPVNAEIYSLQGLPLTITGTDPLQVNDVNVSQPDLLAANGVIHAIDDLFLPQSATNDLYQILKRQPYFSTLVRLLDKSEILERLQGPGPYTLLAPTNEAFDGASASTMILLESDPLALIEALAYHVLPGNIIRADFKDNSPFLRLTNGTAPVEYQDIIVGDTIASNGILQTVNRLQYLPETLAPTATPLPTSIIGILRDRGEFQLLLDALEQSEQRRFLTINGALNPFTIFAPRDAALSRDLPAKFLQEEWKSHLINTLTYHIVRGYFTSSNITTLRQKVATLNYNALNVTSVNPPQVNDVNLVEMNIYADNGLIHVVDQMILPPSATQYAVGLYKLFPEFTGFLDLLELAGMMDVYTSEGPFTFFSPVDGAVANLITVYGEQSPATWKEILRYHIIPGAFVNFNQLIKDHTPPETLPPGPADPAVLLAEWIDQANDPTPPPLHTFQLTSLQGSNVTVTVRPNRVGNAGFLFEDLLVLNGVVQVIDAVLIPPNLNLALRSAETPVAAAQGELPAATLIEDPSVSVGKEGASKRRSFLGRFGFN